MLSHKRFKDEIKIMGDLNFLNFKDLKKISKKTLFGSPLTIIIGLFFINIYVFFYFIKKNYRKLI